MNTVKRRVGIFPRRFARGKSPHVRLAWRERERLEDVDVTEMSTFDTRTCLKFRKYDDVCCRRTDDVRVLAFQEILECL